jgi:hypothetical protein
MGAKSGWIAVLGLVAIFLIRVAAPISRLSQNVDEPYHVGAAVSMWEAKAYVLGLEQPPLTRWVSGVPLMLMGAELPEYRGTTMSRKGDEAYAAGVKVLCAGDRERCFRLLSGARWAMTVFPILAILYAFLLGRRFAGVYAGTIAAALVSFDPTMLGHGFWVCTDAAAAAGFLAVLFHWHNAMQRPSTARLIVAGIAIGLAISCKFSVVVVLPALLVMYAIARIKFNTPRIQIFGWSAIALAAFVALWATFFFRIGTLGNSDTLASAPQWNRIPARAKNVPVPMPAMWIGLARLAAHSAQGHGTELFGKISNRGWWYYFPVVVLTKTPVVMLVLMAAGICAALAPRESKLAPGESAPTSGESAPAQRASAPGAAWTLLWPAGFFFFISMVGSIQIGIRHVLPAIACAHILAAIWLSRRSWIYATVVLLLLAVESFPFGQEYIAYYNPVARPWGDHIALGSNYDWGQDVVKLTDSKWKLDAIYPLGDRQAPLFKTLGLDPALLDAPAKPGARVAVSLSRRLIGPGDFEFLKHAKVVGRVGDGFNVFEMQDSGE